MRLADQLRLLNENKKPGRNNDYHKKTPWPDDSEHTKQSRLDARDRARRLLFKEVLKYFELRKYIDSQIPNASFVNPYGYLWMLPQNPIHDLIKYDLPTFIEFDEIQSFEHPLSHIAPPIQIEVNPVMSAVINCLHENGNQTTIDDWMAFVANIKRNMSMIRVAGASIINTLWDSRHIDDIQAVELPELELEVSL